SSPYYPGVKPMRRIRARARWNLVDYNLFLGFVEEWPQEWPEAGKGARVRISAVDAFKVLNLYQLSAGYASHLTGTRMGTVLTAAGIGTAERSLDAGQSTLAESGALTSSALQHLQDVAETENGLFFVDPGGTVVFQDRHHRILNESSASGTIGDAATEIRYGDVATVYGDSQIWNQAVITPSGGTADTITDAASTASYWTRTLERSLLISSQTEGRSAGQYLISRFKDPYLHIPTVTLVGARDTTQWPTILGLDISNRVLFRFRPPSGGTVAEDEHVEAIAHRITGDWRVGLNLSAADAQGYWVMGDAANSLVGVTTRPTY
ncbi:MAG: hypothetical protein NUW01_13750, partial [Gemmatimonadaceae bacterium]|nr:hypothetical protein [Gemmatimonadaceae bacterium]